MDRAPNLIPEPHVPNYMTTFSVAWTIVALGNLVLTERLRWHPELVGAISAGAAACLIALRFAPHAEWAYRLGGTLAIGSIGFRAASIGIGSIRVDARDGALIATISVSILAMFGRLYWDWWLHRVGPWHREHVRRHHEL